MDLFIVAPFIVAWLKGPRYNLYIWMVWAKLVLMWL